MPYIFRLTDHSNSRHAPNSAKSVGRLQQSHLAGNVAHSGGKMKRYHVKPTAIKTAYSPTIPLLLFFFCVVLFITATEADEALKSRSPVVPTANGDWPQAFFDTAHTGYNRYESQ